MIISDIWSLCGCKVQKITFIKGGEISQLGTLQLSSCKVGFVEVNFIDEWYKIGDFSYIDVLDRLDASLSSFFSLTTDRTHEPCVPTDRGEIIGFN